MHHNKLTNNFLLFNCLGLTRSLATTFTDMKSNKMSLCCVSSKADHDIDRAYILACFYQCITVTSLVQVNIVLKQQIGK